MRFWSMGRKVQARCILSLGRRVKGSCAAKCQRGFSLITAIFLLVVIVSLGTLMVTFWAAQQQDSALEVLGARAYQASRAGVEWGTFQISHSQVAGASFATSCQTGTSSVPAMPTTQPDLAGTPFSPSYTLAISCFATSHVENAGTVWAYGLVATVSGVEGASPGMANYVERRIQATIWQ